jgi:hypothetical protein
MCEINMPIGFKLDLSRPQIGPGPRAHLGQVPARAELMGPTQKTNIQVQAPKIQVQTPKIQLQTPKTHMGFSHSPKCKS